jgi:hypothetical protein
VIKKVNNGLESAKAQGTISQSEAEQRLKKWLIK